MAANSADRKSIRALEKASKVADTIRADVIRSIMATASGRFWMWDQLATCHIFHQTFTGDPLTTAFNEGQRSIGLDMMADILRVCPDQYLQAQRESNERSTLIEQRSSPVHDGRDSGPIDDPGLGGEASGASDPAPSGPEEWGPQVIGADAPVIGNGYARPYRNLDHN